jgi:hypothetical protein
MRKREYTLTLLQVTHGFPHNPSPLFNQESTFPIENREGLVHQDVVALSKCVNAAHTPQALKKVLADFHVLCFIQSTDMFTPEEFRQLCSLATSQEGDMDQLNHINGWNTLQMVLREAGKICVLYVMILFLFVLYRRKRESQLKNFFIIIRHNSIYCSDN